jgi:putative 2-oxoglutarate-Fe(II)-dependent oxygenase superfamily protein
MSLSTPTHGDQAALPDAIRVGDALLPTWPQGQPIEPLSASLMAITTFADHACFHPALIQSVLHAEQEPRFRGNMFKGGCGVKVRSIPAWDDGAAKLIHARAVLLAHTTLSRRDVFADDTWGSIYRFGDYCMPHSHLRSNVSIVYMLDTGDDAPEDDLMSAKLCFADPRIDACCPHEPGRVTQHVMPTMTPGTMLIFASDYLHSVNPYFGKRPRITLSWNVTLARLPGRAGEGWM